MVDDKNRLRKTYSFFRQQPVYASGGGAGGGTGELYWFSSTAGAIFTTGSVAIRGASGGVDAAEDAGVEVFFYVSGTIGEKNLSDANISVFGGDVVVSGSLTSLTALSGSLTKLANGTSYLIAGSGVSISTGSSGAVTISSTGTPGGTATQVQFNDGGTFGGDSGLTYNKTTDTLSGVNVVLSGDLTVNGTMTTVNTNNLEVKDAIIGLGFASGSIGQSGNDRGLILGLGNSPHATFLWKNSESEFAVGLTTSSATGSLPIALSSYSNFHANNIQGNIITASLGFSGSLTTLANGTSYLVAGNNITISSASSGQVTISSTAAGSGDQFFSSTTAGSIFTTGSTSFVGGEAGVDSPADKGTNVFFYVSGSISGSGANDKRSLFGGDVVISGSLRQGLQTNASGFYSHAEGQNTTASGTSAHAEGSSTTASASAAHAEGVNTTASGIYSHAEGLTTTASGIASHAEGQFTVASGQYSHAEGASSTASGIASHAEGSSTEAVGTYSLTAGIGTIASGSGQNVFGKYNLRNNASSLFVIGDGTATGDATRGDILRVNAGPTIGRGRFDVTGTISANVGLSGSLTRLTDGTSYLIAGSNITIVTGSNGAVTISSTASGGGDSFFSSTTVGSIFTTGSAAFRGEDSSLDSPADVGSNVFFYVSGSISGSGVEDNRAVFGGDLIVSGALAQGNRTKAQGQYSHAEGRTTTALGIYSHAEGWNSVASGNYSHAEGTGTSSGDYSHAEGVDTAASGTGAHAEGDRATASGQYSHAEGLLTTANNDYSHAEGEQTAASGYASHAQGDRSVAFASYSFAGGIYTIASGSGQTVFGKYNKRDNDTSLFVIGDGSADPNASRNDILRVNSGSTPGFGRVEVTGSFAATLGLSGSLTKLIDGTSYLIAGSGVSISTGSSGAVTISSSGVPGGSTTQVQFNDGGAFGGDSGLVYDKSTDTLTGVNVVLSGDLTVNGTMTTVNTTNLEVKDAVIGLGFASGSIGQSGNDRGLILGLGNSPHAAFLWKHSENEFAVGSTSASATGSLPIALSNYSNFHANNIQGNIITASLGFSGSLTNLIDGTSYLIAGNNVAITTASNGSITISSTAVSSGDQFFTSTTVGSIFTTGSTAFRGNNVSIDSPSDVGANVFFFVSGSVNASGGEDKRAIFGGDVVISGSLRQGFRTNASGSYSHAEGSLTVASGYGSHAEGSQSVASGQYSHAEGGDGVASGQYSHAEGQSTTASSTAAHAEGFGTTASGLYSHAEGDLTLASGVGSHSEGFSTTASGQYSHAEGLGTIASGNYSHSEGQNTVALGISSKTAGIGTIASGSYQVVFGKYNARDNSSSLFVIGDGTATSNATRGDILRVNSGSVIGRGRVEVTGSFAATLGLSGSLTRLTDGTSYLIAGSNIVISSASNGSVTISSTASGGGDSFFNSTTNASIFTTGSAAFVGTESFIDSPTDKGTDVFFYVSGSNQNNKSLFGGTVFVSGSLTAKNGLSGSLTKLADGTSYLVAGENVTITTASNGSVTIQASGVGYSKGYFLGSSQDGSGNINVSTVGTLVNGYDEESDVDVYRNGQLLTAGASNDYTVPTNNTVHFNTTLNPDDVITVRLLTTGSTSAGGNGTGNAYTTSFTNSSLVGGILTVNHGLTSQYVVVVVYDNLDYQVLPDEIIATSAGVSDIDLSSFGTIAGTWKVVVVDGSGNAGDITNVIAGTGLSGGGTSGAVTLNINDSIVATVSGTTFTGQVGLTSVKEKLNVLSGATGTVTHNCSTGYIFYHSAPSSNFTANFTNFTSSVGNGFATSVTLILSQSSPAYIPNAIQLDGNSQTINWFNSATPSGTANKKDVVSFSIMGVSGSYVVLGQLSTFG